MTSKVLEIKVSPRAIGSLIKVRGELPLKSLNLLKKYKTLKISLENLKSFKKYRVSKRDIDVFKCLEDKDVQYNLIVVEVLYEGGEIRFLANANEALKLSKVFIKIK